MILNSIELKNIRSYEHEKIEFPRGITLFEGDNGSGKSTVLMAIEFSLFGLGSQKSDSLLSKKENEGYVVLNFEVDGKRYEIKRKLRRKGDSVSQESKSCYLISDGEMEPLAASDLKQRVLQILKFNEPLSPTSGSRIYRYAVFTPQEEMKQILRDSDMRLETIRKAFGMEDYKTASENAKTMIFTLKTKTAVSKEGFSKLDELKKILEKSTKEERKESQEISNLMKQLNTAEKRKSVAHKTVDEARKKREEKVKLELKKDIKEKEFKDSKSELDCILEEIGEKKQEIQDANYRIIHLKKIPKPTSKSISQIDYEITNIEDLNNKIANVNSKIDATTEDMSGLSRKLGAYINEKTEDLDNQLVELNNLLTRLTGEYKDVMCLITDKEKASARLEERKQDLESKLKNVSDLGSKCPICENRLTEEHIKNLEKERRRKLQAIIDSTQQIQNEINKNCIKRQSLEKQISENKTRGSKIEIVLPLRQHYDEKNTQAFQLRLKLQELTTEIVIQEEKSFPNDGKFKGPLLYMKALRDTLIQFDNADKQIEEEKIRKQNAEERFEKIEKKKNLIEQEISDLEGQLSDISKRLMPLRDIDGVLRKAEKDEETVLYIIENLKVTISTNKERVRHVREEIQRVKGEISEAEKNREKYEKFSNCHDWLNDFFIPTVEQVEKHVLHSIQHNFNSIYQNWFSVLIDDPTKQSRIDEDFSPIVEQDGYEQDVDYLSGGEKTSIALAYRLTLNSMMRQETECLKSNLLILDEPTDGFSKTQLSKVKDLLQQLHSQQIILVSHENELETYVDNIYYISKDSGISHVHRRSN